MASKKVPGMKIKKGDRVIVIAGRDNGREGRVIAAFPDKQRVLVQGVNMIKKNKKVDYQSQGGLRDSKQGGIIHQEALIHVSRPGHQEARPRGLPARRQRQEGQGLALHR